MDRPTKIAFASIIFICLLVVVKVITHVHEETNENTEDKVVLDSNYKRTGVNTYDYVIPKDGEIHFTLPNDIADNYNVSLDGMVINVGGKHCEAISDTHKVCSTDYYIKPEIHEVVINEQKFIINSIYQFDTSKHFDPIDITWDYNKDFVTLTKNGIVLKNTSDSYRIFKFGRNYQSKGVLVTYTMNHIKFVPGTAFYFGQVIYFTVNNGVVDVMRRVKDGTEHVKRVKIDKIKEGIDYTITMRRSNHHYTLGINNTYINFDDKGYVRDNVIDQFRSVGLTIPKGGSEILIKKVDIREK